MSEKVSILVADYDACYILNLIQQSKSEAMSYSGPEGPEIVQYRQNLWKDILDQIDKVQLGYRLLQ
jgi:hypothetical protein